MYLADNIRLDLQFELKELNIAFNRHNPKYVLYYSSARGLQYINIDAVRDLVNSSLIFNLIGNVI